MARPKGSKNKISKKIKTICRICNKEFYGYPSHNRKYCSSKCVYIAQEKGIKKDKPIGERIEKICLQCNEKFIIPFYKSQQIYCSVKCRNISYIGKFCGKNGHTWKGGRIIDQYGYICIAKPKHPYCDGKGYIREHRLVMEKHLGRYLTKKEVVHHLDFNKANNKIENLHLFTDIGKHHSYHLRLQSLVNHSLLGKEFFDNKSYMKEYRLGKRRKKIKVRI